MKLTRRLEWRTFWPLSCGLLVSLAGCQPTINFSTFLQDFARQALAAFVL